MVETFFKPFGIEEISVEKEGFFITSHSGCQGVTSQICFGAVIVFDLRFNNIHAKISACSLAENTSINPKQCRKLKLSAKS